ncbi:radical SAM domain/B12 binding domain protein (plasmid) [Streptantibioticus cattleyicolor NRRL 8057 = DSM 46488]|uniref:Radical SAM domain/B12 binding domain protein n=1 Tax=Streptantibioticus cattleyicolor (strain ATCC 35852 / DSM 46488 / JCM 4925 / NBRC 14057 / NRRL 8057) TaxID=1003195 RepID=G8XEE9_STREN|nr:radical SAM domain/B12 binding domain protein [Streptantibioticus cattleyicolor NRRL 8057 = DSM 46488]
MQPPNGFVDRYDLAPPLGLLTLAAVAREHGAEVSLVDFNLMGMGDPSLHGADFYPRAVRAIAETQPDLVGFTSMAVESHVCLELARLLKAADPRLLTVLGGPHFSSIAREALDAFDWIDYVVTGEGEQALISLLRVLGGAPGELVNVAHRSGGEVALRRALKGMTSLDELPFPAYDLVELDDYFALNPLRLLNVDHARGCMFRCSFCYSPGHWGQGEQTKSASAVAEQVARMHAMGARHLFFVQDNLVNSVKATQELCAALTGSGTGITWNAYATMQRLTPDLLDRLAAAGCTELFVGVDAISEEAQRSFAKHFFKGWEPLKQRLRDCLDRGIIPTCAFMIDIPEGDDHRSTDLALTTALLTRNLGCGIRLNTLTVYNATATATEFAGLPRSYTDLKPRLLLDTPPVVQDNPYARRAPGLFPFHSTFLPLPAYTRFVSAMHAAYTLFSAFPRTLLQYVLVDEGSLWELLEAVVGGLDLLAVEPRRRRAVERERFQDLFAARRLSASTRDAFALECAELRVSLAPGGPAVEVSDGTGQRWFQPRPHEVVRLQEPLADLSRDHRAEPVESPGDYLVLRKAGQLEYFAADPSLLAQLERIRGTAAGSGPVTLDPDVLAELTAAGVLDPVKEV